MKLAKVIVNGKEFLIAAGTVLDYNDIADLAHPRPLYTITSYMQKTPNQGRSISIGDSLAANDGLVITCMECNKA